MQSQCKIQSRPVYVGCTRFHFNCANNAFRDALPAISPPPVSGNHAVGCSESRICQLEIVIWLVFADTKFACMRREIFLHGIPIVSALNYHIRHVARDLSCRKIVYSTEIYSISVRFSFEVSRWNSTKYQSQVFRLMAL